MKIVEKMAKKAADNWNEPGVTIAFLGDSVTQGCFELYRKGEEGFETYFDKNGVGKIKHMKGASFNKSNEASLLNTSVTQENRPLVFNDIRSLSERVIYLRYDIHLRWMIYASHMKERILYHICRANISYGLPYIISHSDISFNLAPSPLLCYNTPKAVIV